MQTRRDSDLYEDSLVDLNRTTSSIEFGQQTRSIDSRHRLEPVVSQPVDIVKMHMTINYREIGRGPFFSSIAGTNRAAMGSVM
jgi:hypothetical protein